MTGPVVSTPQPHADWGLPSEGQRRYLAQYIANHQPMSIYGDTGVYQDLESRLSNIYGSKYCILTNTGTSALSSAYFAIGISRGDEVIVPTYTFLATVTPLLRLGAKIVFCDADSRTGNISPVDLERKLSSRTKAVAITHMWGMPCDMTSLLPLIKATGAHLVEDCSHAHFTKFKGRLLGSFGDVACFSIGAKKTMTSGEGGFLLTSDPEIFVRATLLGHFGLRSEEAIKRLRISGHAALAEKYAGYTIGYGENYRMHPYSAALAFALIESGEIYQAIARRRESLQYFEQGLHQIPGIDPPQVDADYYSGAMFGFKPKILCVPPQAMGEFLQELRDRNVYIKRPDSLPLHKEPVFGSLSSEAFDGAEEYLRGRVSMPTFSNGLPDDRPLIDEYLEVLHYVVKRRGNADIKRTTS